jgi:uncharacterized protein
MDSSAMNAITKALAENDFRVVRFEFDYIALRREGHRKPPPRAETLGPQFIEAVRALDISSPLIIGGKSMGGRVASLVADQLYAAGAIQGLLCLGYPFHPVGKPEQTRTAHLADIRTPTLIVQGTRDPFGTQEEVGTYRLSRTIEILWLDDGDHDFRPRKSVSGHTLHDHLRTMAAAVAAWRERITA